MFDIIRKPKILLWDLETGYNLVTVFGLFNDYINYKMIQNERYIICGSFKELGVNKVSSVSLLDDPQRFKNDPTDDKYVVKAVRDKLKDADAIIAHNGDNFDVKFFNSRCIYHGLQPLPNIVQIDTLKMAKSKFRFNANRLDYLAGLLGVGHKVKTDDELWLDCFYGKKKAVRDMIKYNKEDVRILEGVYNKLAPYCKTQLNMNLFTHENVCPNCGSHNLNKEGRKYTATRVYEQYSCNNCGKWSSSSTAVKDVRALIK